MRTRKLIILFIALMFPVTLVMLFQFFSEGVYEVPLLYTEEVENIPEECTYTYRAPYLLPDSILEKYSSLKESPLTVFYFNGNVSQVRQRLNHIKDEFSDDSIPFIYVQPDSVPFYNKLKKCVFLVRNDSSVVLVDSAKRIRGYYNAASQEEVDRLVAEMRVILKK